MTRSAAFYAQAQQLADQIVAWRRDIHMHPELGFQEQRTARLVADTLAEFGIEAQTGVGKTGVVGYLGEGSPVIGIRADMDALPIQEENDVPYRSQAPGVMHACGHDAHTAILLGVAKMLSEMPDRPPGQVRFLFQPSEENSDEDDKSGATRMIEDGALEGVDAVIALHVASDLPAGAITVEDGYSTANEDSFQVVLKGTGGHGAYAASDGGSHLYPGAGTQRPPRHPHGVWTRPRPPPYLSARFMPAKRPTSFPARSTSRARCAALTTPPASSCATNSRRTLEIARVWAATLHCVSGPVTRRTTTIPASPP